MNTSRAVRMLLASVSFGALLPGLGFAIGPAMAAPNDEATNQIETVVVTAEKRGTDLQKTSSSITALTQADIEKQGLDNYEDLVRGVPGIIATGIPNLNNFVVRGIQTSATTSSIGNQKLTTMYLDDIPLTSFSVITPSINPYDIERVEVLRGPQGTLFGAGSEAGAVRFITNKPDVTKFDAALNMDIGTTSTFADRHRFGGMINVPLIDDELAVRVVAYDHKDGGWVDNVDIPKKNINTDTSWGYRASAKWVPNNRLTATVMLTDDNSHTVSPMYDATLGTNRASGNLPFYDKNRVVVGSGTIEYDLGWAQFNSSTSYARAHTRWNLDLDGIINAFPFYYYEENVTKSFVEDANLVSKGDGPLTWIVGLFYMTQNTDFNGALNTTAQYAQSAGLTGLPSILTPPNINLSHDVETKNTSEKAIYGELAYAITPEIKATAGVRVAQTNFTNANTCPRCLASYDSSGAFIGAAFAGGNAVVPIVPIARFTATTGNPVSVTPKFVLSWQPDEDKNFYVLASEGFRRPQPNGRAAGASVIDPSDPTIVPVTAASDTLWNYEVGAKTLWWEGALRANADVFYMDWKNMQIGLTRQSDGVPFAGNVGSAHSLGLELSVDARPTDQISVGVDLTLQDARVDSLTPLQAIISGGVKGARLVSPKIKLGGYLEYDWSLGDAANLYARVDAQYVGSYPNVFPNLPGVGGPNPHYQIIPAYENVNMSVGWSKGQYDISAYVENLTNNHSPIYINPDFFAPDRFATLRPLTWGVRLAWKY